MAMADDAYATRAQVAAARSTLGALAWLCGCTRAGVAVQNDVECDVCRKITDTVERVLVMNATTTKQFQTVAKKLYVASCIMHAWQYFLLSMSMGFLSLSPPSIIFIYVLYISLLPH